MHVDLEPGEYWLEVFISHAPAIPFRVSISAPNTAVMTLAVKGSDPAVHGITTRGLQGCALPRSLNAESSEFVSPHKRLLDNVLTRRSSKLVRTTISPAVAETFSQADFLQRGHLTVDGAHRALLMYILNHTSGGSVFQEKLKQFVKDSPEGLDVSRFNDVLAAAFAAGIKM
jgi:hypothetical protein